METATDPHQNSAPLPFCVILSPVSGNLSEGQILEGKYRIIRRIGEGGMGVVYEAEHTDLHLRVAIKVLHPAESFDPNMIARFKAEARSAASIRHANVVEVTDFGLTEEQRPFFVMEYLAGESLADRLDRRGALSERECVEIADQILSGLGSAHKRGIVHRDLKPENVLLTTRDDGREVVKLLDFGIAKIVGGTTSHNLSLDEGRPKTLQGVVLGTPGYMAPETVTGRTPADQRSDIFAVGILIFEMIVGRRPFTGETPHEIMMATATKPVPRPTAIRPGISESMERLVLTALAKDPSDRFQNTEEFVRHLTAAAVGRIPDDARQCKTKFGLPSVAPEPAVFSRDVPTEEVRDGRVGAGQVAKAAAGPGRSSRKERAPREVPARPLRRRAPLTVSPLAIILILAIAGGVYYFFFHQDPFRVIDHDEAGKIHEGKAREEASHGEPVDETSAAEPDEAEIRKVTIWLDVRPNSAAVTWDGKAISFRPLVVPKADAPVKVRFDAPGYEPKTIKVIPDEEKTIRVRLRRAKKK